MHKFKAKWQWVKETGAISSLYYKRQRIPYDNDYWKDTLLPKLDFFDNCLGPEIVSPLNALGLPLHNSSKK